MQQVPAFLFLGGSAAFAWRGKAFLTTLHIASKMEHCWAFFVCSTLHSQIQKELYSE